MNTKLTAIVTNKWVIAGLGVVIGAGVLLGIRFITYAPDTVHYHANFAVYVNGEQEQFKAAKYYEETAASACGLEPVESPLERAHMHDGVNSVVHVEDHLVTWGNLFQNINWGIGDAYLKTDGQLYVPNDQSKLIFMLNGKKVDSIANIIIGGQDKLLVSYGSDSSEVLQQQYGTIKNKAQKYDQEQDPAGCSGSHTNASTSERLKHLF